jgi:glutathione S-transferase
MSLTLYYHPLASFCHKTLIALYENETPFTPHFVDLMDPKSNAEFKAIWPIGKFPVLRDSARNALVPESSIIIEYLAQHYPGKSELLPRDPELALRTRMQDRVFDLYLHMQMQAVMGDRLRPADKKDPVGVENATKTMRTSLDMIEKDMATKTWAMGDVFTLADCAAAPALFYANMIIPLAGTYKNAAKYLDRLVQRPSYARVLREAEPYFKMVPK